VRSGLSGVGKGQRDGGLALGLSPLQTFWLVTWPQAFRLILPPLGNSVNGLLKATSLTSVISMEELMRRTELVMQVRFEVLELYLVAAVWYLALTTLWDFLQEPLERRMARAYDPVAKTIESSPA
jgi:polar amino acid transport system permease protein